MINFIEIFIFQHRIVKVILLIAAANAIAAQPVSFPLVHFEVGQDGEDASEGIYDYYAHAEAYIMTFSHAKDKEDARGRALGSQVHISFDAALQAEMYNLHVEEPELEMREYAPIEAPGEGWIIERTFQFPHSNVIILTASLAPDRHRLVFYRIAIGDDLKKLAEIDTRRKSGPHQLADGWWNLEMRPAAVGWRQSPDRDKHYGPRIFFENVPTALREIFPPGQGFSHEDGWWRDGARDEHAYYLDHMYLPISNALSTLDFNDAEAALTLMQRYVEGQYATPDAEVILGDWKVRVMQPDAFGGIVVHPWYEARIEEDYGLVFQKLTGSQRRSGRLYRDFGVLGPSQGLVFLGSKTVHDEPAPVYSGWLLYALPAPDSDTFGRMFALAEDHLLMILDPIEPDDWEMYELRRSNVSSASVPDTNADLKMDDSKMNNNAARGSFIEQQFSWMLDVAHDYLDLGLYFHPLWNQEARTRFQRCMNTPGDADSWRVRAQTCLGQLQRIDSNSNWHEDLAREFAQRIRIVELVMDGASQPAPGDPWLELLVEADSYLDKGLFEAGGIPGLDAFISCVGRLPSPESYTPELAVECLGHIGIVDSDSEWRRTVAKRVDGRIKANALIQQAIPANLDPARQAFWRELLRAADNYLDHGLAGADDTAWTEAFAQCVSEHSATGESTSAASKVGTDRGDEALVPNRTTVMSCMRALLHEDSDPQWREQIVDRHLEPILVLASMRRWAQANDKPFWWNILEYAQIYLDKGLPLDNREMTAQFNACAGGIEHPSANRNAVIDCLEALGIEDYDPDWPTTVVDEVLARYAETMNAGQG